MNHDYAHCLDYTEDCPADCFRAELEQDLSVHREQFIGKPIDYMHLKGTEECKLDLDNNS